MKTKRITLPGFSTVYSAYLRIESYATGGDRVYLMFRDDDCDESDEVEPGFHDRLLTVLSSSTDASKNLPAGTFDYGEGVAAFVKVLKDAGVLEEVERPDDGPFYIAGRVRITEPGAGIVYRFEGSENSEFETCSDCDNKVHRDDVGFATPCGTFCSTHMQAHVDSCEICRKEFGLFPTTEEGLSDA